MLCHAPARRRPAAAPASTAARQPLSCLLPCLPAHPASCLHPTPSYRSACGVKRTRKLRAEAEGAKRRKLSASPAPPPLKGYGKYARTHYGAGGCWQAWARAGGGAGAALLCTALARAGGGNYSPVLTPATPPTPPAAPQQTPWTRTAPWSPTTRRGAPPPRPAAARSGAPPRRRPSAPRATPAPVSACPPAAAGWGAVPSKSASLRSAPVPHGCRLNCTAPHLCRLPRSSAGEWAEGDAADAALRAATPSSSSGYSLPSSSCPEEVSWPPLADAPLGNGSSDCYAAVNLMTMSAKQRSGSASMPAPPAALFSAAPAPAPAPFVGAGPGSSVGGTSAAASPALSGGTLGGSAAAPAAASRPPSSLDVEQFNHDSLAALAAKYDGTGAARHHKASAAAWAPKVCRPGGTRPPACKHGHQHVKCHPGSAFPPRFPAHHLTSLLPPSLHRPRRWCPWTWPTYPPACPPPRCWSWCA